MTSYLTQNGNLVFIYCPVLDNYEAKEREAILRHGLEGKRITVIGLTSKTNFLKREAI